MRKKATYSKNVNPVLPAGKSCTSVCPNVDRLVAEGHDMEALLSLCHAGQFIGAWTMFPDGHARKLVEIEELLAKHHVVNSLESMLDIFGNDWATAIAGVTGWELLGLLVGECGCHPNLPSLASRIKRYLADFSDLDPDITIEFNVTEKCVWWDQDSSGHRDRHETRALSIVFTDDKGDRDELRTVGNIVAWQHEYLDTWEGKLTDKTTTTTDQCADML
ncbi:hypothetical protein [Paraburkholderia bryophila]|uniref:Uncharacterized protein n=1 Tax=Paraburkholderia bryophila TaxID=420952 RepID=A0A7Y9W438_9BURK|nr:hypothetical protein [Paraburkholderia bryophila]NYH13562.1 hypothetical protein [Paraburkholderia bryophila]